VRLEPIRIEPLFVPRIWGAHSLAPLFPEKIELSERIGEAWLTGTDCAIKSGPFAGKDLGNAWRAMPVGWRGTRLAGMDEFPLLVKFLFTTKKLSIQVHPDDAFSAAHEPAAGGRGKTEMWHAIAAEPEAQVLLGLKRDTGQREFLEALGNGALENLFERWPVQAGDTFFVPAGSPHTIGAGLVLCEVQQNCDVTYRIYDYERVDASGKPRELHIAKALQAMKFGETRGGRVAPVVMPVPASPAKRAAKRALLTACPQFATERWEISGTFATQSDADRFELLIMLSGRGRLEWTDGVTEYSPGECWLIPAGLGRISVCAEDSSVILRSYLPDLDRLRADLEQAGLAEPQFAEAIFN
jgi:mannose-6-phosphate isomerase